MALARIQTTKRRILWQLVVAQSQALKTEGTEENQPAVGNQRRDSNCTPLRCC